MLLRNTLNFALSAWMSNIVMIVITVRSVVIVANALFAMIALDVKTALDA